VCVGVIGRVDHVSACVLNISRRSSQQTMDTDETFSLYKYKR
jgi:hypothetical protein